MKKERIEDLGRIFEKIDGVLNDENLNHLDCKHDFETWMKKHFPSYAPKISVDEDESSLANEFYVLHMSLRVLKYNLYDIWTIARGEDE